jgi:hypothetical protein
MSTNATVQEARTAANRAFSSHQLPALFDELSRQRFFGSLQFNFRDGLVVLVRREETTVVTDHRGENPREYASTNATASGRR